MIISMTGFGSAETLSPNFNIKVEFKTLNSKFLDFQIKLPKECQQWEYEIRALVERYLVRGKVSMGIDLQPVGNFESMVNINEPLFLAYYNSYNTLAKKVNANETDVFKLALQSPNVLNGTENTTGNLDWANLQMCIENALKACVLFRETEGKKLEVALMESLKKIETGLENVKQRDPQRAENVRLRINQSLSEIREKTQIDANRFEQEIIYYLEKLDISEEKVRLSSHLEYFEQLVNQPEPSGKVLGFLSQELGREINTIGSKANDADMQREVVSMKEELEKIKEQVLNIL